MELTSAVLQGLRQKCGRGEVLTTACLAEAVEQVFLAMGFPQAAEAYRQAGAAQRHRRTMLEVRRLIDGAAVGPETGIQTGSGRQAPSGHEPFPRV